MLYVVSGLIVMTVGLLSWHHYGMERVVTLSAASGHEVLALDDRAMGGASVATLEKRGQALRLNCQLDKKFEWPYCKIRFVLGAGTRGVDLSRFDTISFDMAYAGVEPHTVRVFIRNFEPSISRVDDPDSQKINEIAFPAPASGAAQFPMKVFRTALWWTEQRHVGLIDSDVRIDNVMTVDVSTGTANPGLHQIDLRAVRFHGKWISQNHLLMLLVGVWILCAVVWPVLGLMHFWVQLKRSNSRLALLSGINRALELEARELAGQAYTDPLTGALNRQGLRDVLMKSWHPSGLLSEAMAVVFVDLDHFKRVNDEHGHGVGDDVLRSFADLVTREIRGSDKLVRWGGEEFLIICQGTSTAQASVLAEKLRVAMSAQVWPCGLTITSSFGVTSLYNGEEIIEAIKRADGALYKAKENGRDCVEVA